MKVFKVVEPVNDVEKVDDIYVYCQFCEDFDEDFDIEGLEPCALPEGTETPRYCDHCGKTFDSIE